MALVARRRRRRYLEQQIRGNRIFRDRRNPFEVFNDTELYIKFRFPREEILAITDEVSDYIQVANRHGSVPPLLQVLLTLRFFASGTFQDICGELIGISQPTASRIIHRVTRALLRTVHRWITFPSQQQANEQKRKYAERFGFPNVFACIDGTHVPIQAPTIDEWQFVNRKNIHSINVQVMSNADLLFIDVVAQWPGSVHDARILRQSRVFHLFEAYPKPILGLVLGDSGYPLRDWLMTPIPNPRTEQEIQYNNVHKSARCTVERAFGVAKRRWSCLKMMRLEPEKVCSITVACCILHNRARILKLPDPDNYEDDQADDNAEDSGEEDRAAGHVDRAAVPVQEQVRVARGRAVRDALIHNFF